MSTKSMFRSIVIIGLAVAASFAIAMSAVPISAPAQVSAELAIVPIVLAAMAMAAFVADLAMDMASASRAALVRIRTYRERILQRTPYLLTV